MMIERDLQAASDLFDKIKYCQNSIAIANTDGANLRIHYKVEPFTSEVDGKLYQHIATAGALGVDVEELRVVVHAAIIKHLEGKIAEYRAQLAKLGVKLDEPPTLEDAKEAGRRAGKISKAKKLAATKKPLAIEGPKTPMLVKS